MSFALPLDALAVVVDTVDVDEDAAAACVDDVAVVLCVALDADAAGEAAEALDDVLAAEGDAVDVCVAAVEAGWVEDDVVEPLDAVDAEPLELPFDVEPPAFDVSLDDVEFVGCTVDVPVAADPDEVLDDELSAAAGAVAVDALTDELDEDEALDAVVVELLELPLDVEPLEVVVLLDAVELVG